ncbi:uncharacterized protein LOC123519248 [Portunus trituberculatus]|uniref:uncharacterized protein LOC123519248 n=1 Tax=Portunus trituberculatus TaxID=210409 RepID=UPI001E1CC9D2|nr:uncharacterized protein LOC123519248 [Portunus trituberculatus]
MKKFSFRKRFAFEENIVKGRIPPDHHPSFWIVRPLPSDTSLISLCHVCLENPASSGHSTSRGPSEHLTESTSSLANTQTAQNSRDSSKTGLYSAALASPSTYFPAPSTSLPPVLSGGRFGWSLSPPSSEGHRYPAIEPVSPPSNFSMEGLFGDFSPPLKIYGRTGT